METSSSESSLPEPQNNSGLKYYLKLITVEPTMFLYMMAFMLTTVVEQAFFIDKACRVNHGFNATICDNINKKELNDYKKIVQVTVSEFHQYNDVAGHIGPIILAFFMGAWSDRRGRKLPLLFGLFGKLYYSAMVVVNSNMATWPLEYVIYTATIPMAVTGADVAIFAAAFSYISDVSTAENRTLRVTILDVVYLFTMPTGIALGSYLFSTITNRSYSTMFIINCSLLVLSLIYTFLNIEWRTTDKQRPWREADNMITDFFDRDHVIQSIKTITKKRPGRKRLFISIFILTMALYTFQRDEKPMSYLYLNLVFDWTVEKFSAYKSFTSAFQVAAMLIGIPIMSKLFHWHDTVIIMVGAVAHAVARIVFVTAKEGWLFFLGGAISAFGPVVGPALRSITSKIIPSSERGKVFSLLSVADNAIPLVSGVLYTQVYNHTIHTMPVAIFYLTMATQMAVFCLILLVRILAINGSFESDAEQRNLQKEDISSGSS